MSHFTDPDDTVCICAPSTSITDKLISLTSRVKSLESHLSNVHGDIMYLNDNIESQDDKLDRVLEEIEELSCQVEDIRFSQPVRMKKKVKPTPMSGKSIETATSGMPKAGGETGLETKARVKTTAKANVETDMKTDPRTITNPNPETTTTTTTTETGTTKAKRDDQFLNDLEALLAKYKEQRVNDGDDDTRGRKEIGFSKDLLMRHLVDVVEIQLIEVKLAEV